MVTQDEGLLPANTAAPRKGRISLLERLGWGTLGIAAAVWIAASLLMIYGASAHTGWSLLVAFVTLTTLSFGLLVVGGPIERFLAGWWLSRRGPMVWPVDRSWEEHWEALMRRAVR